MAQCRFAMHILITRPIPDSAMRLLRLHLPSARITTMHGMATGAGSDAGASPLSIQITPGTVAVICTLADQIDAGFISSLPRNFRVIATYAVGTNNIDITAATARNIWVANTPDVLTEATAEIAVSLMLMCARRLGEGERLTRDGKFRGWAPMFHLGRSVFGKTVGIVGAGRIGRCTAMTMQRGFGCEILYHSKTRRKDFEAACGAKRVDLDELLSQSDFVSLHCPLTPKTKHLINAAALRRMKPTAYLINTARGPVVDEAALVDALEDRVIAGAGLDVYEREPQIHPGLDGMENVVLLPHLGSATVEARELMGTMCAEAVIDGVNGKMPKHCVNA